MYLVRTHCNVAKSLVNNLNIKIMLSSNVRDSELHNLADKGAPQRFRTRTVKREKSLEAFISADI